MPILRLPIVASQDPDSYSNGMITSGAGTLNTLYTKYPGDKVYASQRPAVRVTSDPGANYDRGRGVFYWDAVSDLYFVRNDTVYKGDHTNAIGTISAGRDRVYFASIGTQLAIIDPENDEGWYIASGAPSTVIQITDVDFPTDLAGGAAAMDGYIFVLTKDGLLWNCDLNDVSSWNSLSFIGSDINDDGGVYIGKHQNHICVFGVASIEFFYNAGISIGSPLQRRQDIYHSVGAVEHVAVGENGENILFLGREISGTIGLYKLSQYQVSKVSNDSIDSYIGNTYLGKSLDNFDMKFIVSSSWIGDHLMCFITSVEIETSIYDPIYTLVYDATNEVFGQFQSTLTGIDEFSVISSTNSSSSNLAKGTLMFISNTLGTIDITGSVSDYTSGDSEYVLYNASSDGAYSTTPYWIEGYVAAAPAQPTNIISMNVTTHESDFDTITNKFLHRMSLIGTSLSSSVDTSDIEVTWTDDRYRTFNPSTPRLLKTGLRRSLTRGGVFKRRAYSLDYSGEDRQRWEAIEIDIRASSYA